MCNEPPVTLLLEIIHELKLLLQFLENYTPNKRVSGEFNNALAKLLEEWRKVKENV